MLRVYAAIAALAVLAGAAFYVHRLQVKAGRMEAAEVALSDFRAAVAARDEKAAKLRAEDESRRLALASTLATVSKELADLRSNPIVRVVNREKIVNGQTCPDPALSPDFGRVWNEQADIATRAVSAAR